MDKRVFLAECRDYSPERVSGAVSRVLDGFGGVRGIFGELSGKSVFVKVNLITPTPPERAATTHPAVVTALSRALREAGARVIIGDSCTAAYTEQALRRLYRVTGMEAAAAEAGCELAMTTTHRRAEYPAGKVCRTFDIISPALDCDFVVSAAKLKTHGLAYYTGAVKNLFGCIPGLEKAGMHSLYYDKRRFNRLLCDLCGLIRPAFSIVDGVTGMEGAGPSNGTPKNAFVIGGAVNPYALDLAMCECVSFSPSSVPVLADAAEEGLIPRLASELELLGDGFGVFKTVFKPAAGGNCVGLATLAADKLVPRKLRDFVREKRSPWPVFGKACVKCGRCAEICPRQTIAVGDSGAQPDYSRCIRCYCCQEMCPVGAITLSRRRPDA